MRNNCLSCKGKGIFFNSVHEAGSERVVGSRPCKICDGSGFMPEYTGYRYEHLRVSHESEAVQLQRGILARAENQEVLNEIARERGSLTVNIAEASSLLGPELQKQLRIRSEAQYFDLDDRESRVRQQIEIFPRRWPADARAFTSAYVARRMQEYEPRLDALQQEQSWLHATVDGLLSSIGPALTEDALEEIRHAIEAQLADFNMRATDLLRQMQALFRLQRDAGAVNARRADEEPATERTTPSLADQPLGVRPPDTGGVSSGVDMVPLWVPTGEESEFRTSYAEARADTVQEHITGRDAADATKYWGWDARDHGAFGSAPSYDDYGDESMP